MKEPTRVSSLGPVAETLLIPLCYRAMESRRVDAILRDERAALLVEQLDFDFAGLERQQSQMVFVMLRARQFDRWVGEFLEHGPVGAAGRPVVVEIGCGLDTRFERLGRPLADWFVLDLPEVMELRRQLLGEPEGYRELAGSAFDLSWLEALGPAAGRRVLFLAEGVFPYFAEAEVRRLVLAMHERFPGAELVFDAVPPLEAKLSGLHPSLRASKARARAVWGMRHDRDPEGWAPGILLLAVWRYFDESEPRLGLYRLMKLVLPFANGFRVVRYRLC